MSENKRKELLNYINCGHAVRRVVCQTSFLSRGTDYMIEDDLDPYVGTYDAFVPFEVVKSRERLFLSMFGFRLELFPIQTAGDPDVFQAGVAYVRVRFQKNTDGEVTEATLSWLGEDECKAPKRL